MENAAFSCRPSPGPRRITQHLLAMKLTIVLLTVALLQGYGNGFSQMVSLSGKNVELKSVFSAIKKQTGYVAFYNRKVLEEGVPVSYSVKDMPLEEFLRLILKDQPLTFRIADKTILIAHKDSPPVTPAVSPASNEPPGGEKPIYKGRVMNEEFRPMDGASVMIKGSGKGAYTDRDGIFALEGVSIGTILQISYAGYAKIEFTVKNLEPVVMPGKQLQKTAIAMTVVMKPSQDELDQMQVIAYGKVSKRFNTGNVTTVRAEDIAKNPVSNVLEAIQGHVPGMFVQQATGAPGGGFVVQVRGQASFGINQPLYIVDGVVYPASNAIPSLNPVYNLAPGQVSNLYGNITASGALNGGNALNYLDPSIIESVEIMKDADATSIYGSRGAYGVILITTKKGRPGVPRLNVNNYTGISVHGFLPRLLNTQQYLMLRREAFKNDGVTPGSGDVDLNGTWDTTAYTDWQKVFMGHPALTTSTSASYSGGVGNTSYLIGANYTRQGNIERNLGSQSAGGLNFNINTGSLDQKLNLTLSGAYSSTVNNMLPYDLTVFGQTAPNHPPITLPNGKLDWTSWQQNPAALYTEIYNNVTNNLTSTAILGYSPIRGLTIKASIGYSYLTIRELSAVPNSSVTPLNGNPSATTNSTLRTTSTSTINFDPYADYTRMLGRRGRLSITTGMDMQNGTSYLNEVRGKNYSSDAQIRNPTSGLLVTNNYTTNPNRQLGFFGRVNYIWDQKYILNLTGRYDGSTKFGPNYQFGTFGAIGAAWIFSEEVWVRDHLRWLSFGKLRGSYGTSGGDGISNYQYLSQYSTSANNYEGGLAISPNNIANPNLHWETDKKAEIAIELGFLKDRISVAGDYYDNRSSDQLVSQGLSSVTGFNGINQNSPALIKNTGVEGTLSTVNIRSKHFTWTTNFNITVNRNKLVRYPLSANAVQLPFNWLIGKSLQNARLYKYAGVDPQTGQNFYTNAKGLTDAFAFLSPNSLSPATDLTENRDLAPRYYGGIGNTFTYKGFTLDFFFLFTSGLGRNELSQQGGIGLFNTNLRTSALKRWQHPGDVTNIPKASQSAVTVFSNLINFGQSTGAFSDATYARLQNLSLSYSFQPSLLKRARINALQVYVKGQNLLTISKFKANDPENLIGNAMPPRKIFTGGINITL
jgi:TonB-linked SusC/RagA family outer membrane protein